MADFARLPVVSGDVDQAFERFFRGLLEREVVQALLLPLRQPDGRMVSPTLVRDKNQLSGLDLLAPINSISLAKIMSLLTYKDPGFRIGAFLRPCDYRAYVELVKLKQARRDGVLIISLDCLGRLETEDFLALRDRYGRQAGLVFHQNRGKIEPFSVQQACRVCEFPVFSGPDIQVLLLGVDLEKEIFLQAFTDRGQSALKLEKADKPGGRDQVLKDLLEERKANLEEMLATYGEKATSLAGLRDLMKTCINCYNCRVACPVCYCRECVFLTDTFRHDPDQYFHWADKRGQVKLPTDTIFYHLTRMVHISTNCVGCGQCSAACPMDLPLTEIFRTTARRTQSLFDYQPGRSLEEPPPLTVFENQELLELTGQRTH